MPPSKPPPQAPEPAPRSATPVIVAVLGLAGVLGGALLSNWDKVFGSRPASETKLPSPATSMPINSGSQSPVLSGVSGPVTINYGVAAPASAPADPGAPLARLQGVWWSAPSAQPFQEQRRFRLRLELRLFGGELSGQVSDVAEGRTAGPSFEIGKLTPVPQGLDFQVDSSWCCEAGQLRPYQIFYTLRLQGESLALSRRNNAPGGGHTERFLLSRQP